jgi:Zn-dependent peptidase ImmA (M78 family)
LWDIIEHLKENNSKIGDFAQWHFQDDEVRNALLGKDEKQKAKDESTLDELFARTLQLRSTDKFKEVIKFVAALREYKPFNNMLVKLQRPDARYYATASHLKKKFGRDVKPEAIPIVILRPMGPVMLVYDVDDTTGKKLPPQIEDPFSVSGEFDTEFYYQTCLSCQKIGIEVREVNLTKSHAGTAIRESQATDIKLIVQLNQNHDVKVQYATLCHELAHLFLGHLGGDPYGNEWNSRIGLTLTQRELEAEAVAYILCVRAGLKSNSAEYLSPYLEDPEDIKKISVEAIMKTVTYIELMSSRTFPPRRPKAKNG